MQGLSLQPVPLSSLVPMQVQQRAAMSLAKLAPTDALHRIFAVRQGLDVLLGMLTDKVCAHSLMASTQTELKVQVMCMDKGSVVQSKGLPDALVQRGFIIVLGQSARPWSC